MYKVSVMLAAACIAVFLAGCVSQKYLPLETDKSANERNKTVISGDIDVIINNEGNTTATSGYVFRWYDVSVVNQGLSDYPILGNFTLKTCDGSVYQSIGVGSVDFDHQKNNHTYIGDRVSGIVAFKVPAGAKPKLLRYIDNNNLGLMVRGGIVSHGVFINIYLSDSC